MGEQRAATGHPTGEPSSAREVAPGGWRRALIGVLVGLLAGAAIAALLPRERGPRRTQPLGERPRPFD